MVGSRSRKEGMGEVLAYHLDFLSGAGGNPSDFDVTSIKTELVP
jgi:hypothetical protein